MSCCATPPEGFPAQVIIMDTEAAKRHPDQTFYLRVAGEHGGAENVRLEDAVTPLDARRIARAKGYAPTHWMMLGDALPMLF